MRHIIVVCAMFLVLLIVGPATALESIFHDPWLNWDFKNLTGLNTNDFEIIVENGAFNPNPLAVPPEVLMGMPYQNFAVTHADFDGDLDLDTKLSWSNPIPNPPGLVAPNQIVHVGGDMRNSGKILDAGWTMNGVRVPVVPGGPKSIAISYELTEIRPTNSGEIHMQLQIAPQYFKDRPTGAEAGWTGIRTFVNIPADLLGLADLNNSLVLNNLAAYEVFPQYGKPGLPGTTGITILPTDQILMNVDSFFDVYLATVDAGHLGPQYESLLYAQVLNAGAPIGQFWNLNPQCPEPGTWVMLVGGALTSLICFGWRRLIRR